MKHTVLNYRAIIKKDDNDTYYAVVPSLPGCFTQGATIEETKANLKEAITLHLQCLAELDQEIPTEDGVEAVTSVSVKDIFGKTKVRYA